MEQNKNIKGITFHNPLHKKFWYSITKFEKYPEMAAEGVGRAIGYLAWLMLLFAIIIAIGLMIKFNMMAKNGVKYLEKTFSEINYENAKLDIMTYQNEFATDFGKVIINTNELPEEKVEQYKNNSINGIQIIWLKDKVIAKYDKQSFEIYYKDVLDNMGLKQFNKQRLVDFLYKKINSPQIYLLYGFVMTIYLFLAYFIATLIDILVLSIFGLITTLIAQIKMRYRAVFNMSVYAITISTFLQVIYILIKTFTDFNIKYFDLMYTTISFICLAAAIFMIKSDVIKQQLELMKIIEIKRQEKEEQKDAKDGNDEEQPEEEKKEDNNENNEKKDDGHIDGDIEGSNA